MRAWRRRVVVAMVASIGIPGMAHAHAIHSTLTEISVGPSGMMTVRIRAFADDFSAAVSRFARTQPRPDFTVDEAEAARYLARTVTVAREGGPAVPLTLASMRRAGDVVWLELHAPARTLSGLLVRNAMLFEVHRDQVNVVKATYTRTSFTTLFSSGDKARRLP